MAAITTNATDEPATTTPTRPDPAPLWMPTDEAAYLRSYRSTPPSHSDRWSIGSRLTTAFLRSPRVAIARIGLVVSAAFFISALPTLADQSSWSNLWRVAWYHGWTLGVLLLITIRTRSLASPLVVAYTMGGATIAAGLVYYLNGPITDLTSSDTPSVWVIPPLEEAAKLIVVAGALLLARRRLRGPGLGDLLVLGYAAGAGFAFHEDALWGRVTASGFEGTLGTLVPSFFQAPGLFVVGHAAWTALVALGLGLVVLHRRRPALVVAGAVFIVVPLLDHMSVNDRNESFDWVVDLFYDHKLPAWLLLGGVALALGLDLWVRSSMAERDNLLDVGRRENPAAGNRILGWRYQRLRNGVYYARHRDRTRWPMQAPRATPMAALVGRVSRLAGYAPSPMLADRGWEPDPDDPARMRWRTQLGWTPYIVSGSDPATATPSARPDAVAESTENSDRRRWLLGVAGFTALVVAAAVIRLLTLPDEPAGGIQFAPILVDGPGTGVAAAIRAQLGGFLSSLPDAPNDPGNWTWPAAVGAAGAGQCPGPGDELDDMPPLSPDDIPNFDVPPDGPPGDEPSEEEECP